MIRTRSTTSTAAPPAKPGGATEPRHGGGMVIPRASLTIQAQTSGISLLEPNLTVYDNNEAERGDRLQD